MIPPRARFGGLGAIVFLATFAGIAAYVQERSRGQKSPQDGQQTQPLKTAAVPGEPGYAPSQILGAPSAANPGQQTLTVDATGPNRSGGTWRERLDFSAIKVMPFATSVASGDKASKASIHGSQSSPTKGKADEGRQEHGLYVQTMDDGHKVLFTLDPGLQHAASTIFHNREVPFAAAVMMDLRDNAILAMAAHSAMDAQADPLEILGTPWAPAASVFKLVTAEALMHTQKGGPASRACFHGGLSALTDDLLRDDPKLDKRCETLAAAIAHSHNVVIAKLALRHLTQEDLLAATKRFGFGQRLAFEFPLEPSPATIPADARARAKVAAGFWQVDLSPIHAALLTSVIARDGFLQPPHVIAQVLDPEGNDITPSVPAARPSVEASVARRLGKMMVATTTEGTAQQSFFDSKTGISFTQGVTVAGKTGNLNGRRAPSLNYNWFVGYAPAENPEIAFAVILANPAKWQIKAHYAARRLVQVYLERREAIASARSARLTTQGLVAGKDPLIARAPGPVAGKAKTTTATADDLRLAQREEQLGEAPANTAALPRAVGSSGLSVPTTPLRARSSADSGTLPPVPGSLPNGSRASSTVR